MLLFIFCLAIGFLYLGKNDLEKVQYFLFVIRYGTPKTHFKRILEEYKQVNEDTPYKQLLENNIAYGLCSKILAMDLPNLIKNKMVDIMRRNGVNTAIYYCTPPSQAYYKGNMYKEAILPRIQLLEKIIKS